MVLFNCVEIEKIQEQLNSNVLLPGKSYRRNVAVYELVCYVNNIVACYVSRNAEPIPLFIERARTFIEGAEPAAEWLSYYASVLSYLSEMEKHLIANGVNVEY